MLGTLAPLIGYAVFAKIAYSVAYWAYACFFRPGKNLKKEYGEWAIVTGATDGIGKGMAKELVKKGLKVLLISRSPEKLAETSKELGADRTETLAIDYSNFDAAAKTKLKEKISGKEIGVLVNNVGCSYDHAEFFEMLADEEVDKLVKLNIDSTNWMCKIVLPSMLARKRGAIVNMSSAAGFSNDAVLYAEYGASKAYIVALSNALHAEYAGKGIHVQVQYPNLVTSKLSKVRKPSLTVPSADEYGRVAVKAIGHDRHLSPHWAHWIEMGILSYLPLIAVDKVMWMMHLPLRKRYYKKMESQSSKDK